MVIVASCTGVAPLLIARGPQAASGYEYCRRFYTIDTVIQDFQNEETLQVVSEKVHDFMSHRPLFNG